MQLLKIQMFLKTRRETDVQIDDEETTVPEKTENENETTTVGGGSETSAKLTEGWSSDSLQYVKNGAYVTSLGID